MKRKTNNILLKEYRIQIRKGHNNSNIRQGVSQKLMIYLGIKVSFTEYILYISTQYKTKSIKLQFTLSFPRKCDLVIFFCFNRIFGGLFLALALSVQFVFQSLKDQKHLHPNRFLTVTVTHPHVYYILQISVVKMKRNLLYWLIVQKTFVTCGCLLFVKYVGLFKPFLIYHIFYNCHSFGTFQNQNLVNVCKLCIQYITVGVLINKRLRLYHNNNKNYFGNSTAFHDK